MKSLTPDTSQFSETLICRKISLSGSLWSYVNIALEKLTKEYNWQQFGDATPEETAQYFIGIIDDMAQSDCGAAMNWRAAGAYTVFSESYVMTSGYQISIDSDDLPSDLQEANALACRMQVRTETANKQLAITQADGSLGQYYSILSANVIHYFSVMIPIKNGLRFSVNESVGNDVTWQCQVIGWL